MSLRVPLKKAFTVVLAAILISGCSPLVLAQSKSQSAIDSILKILPNARPDYNLVKTYMALSESYLTLSPSYHLLKTDTAIVRASYYAEKEMALALKLKSSNGLGYSYSTQGYIAEKEGDFDQAVLIFKRAYDLPGNQPMRQAATGWIYGAFATNAVGNLGKEKSNTQPLRIWNNALNFFTALHDKQAMANVYSAIGMIYLLNGDAAAQLKSLLKGTQVFTDSDTSGAHIAALGRVSAYYIRLNNSVQALVYSLKAQSLTGKKTSPRILYDLYDHIGQLYVGLNDYKEALDEFRLALRLNENNSVALTRIALVYRFMNEPHLAFAKDIEAFKMKHDEIATSQIYNGLAQDYYLLNDFGNAYNADHKSEAAIEANVQNGQTFRVGDAQKTLVYGQIIRDAPDSLLLRVGVQLHDRFKIAEHVFVEFLKAQKKFRDLDGEREAYRNLNLLYEKENDTEKAYKAYKQYKITGDSIEKLDNGNEVTRRNLQYGYRHREDSIGFKQLIASNLLRSQLTISGKDKALQHADFLKSQANLAANKARLKASQKERALAVQTVILQNTQIKAKQLQGNYMLGGIAGLIGLSFFIARNYINQRKSNRIIFAEKQRSDALLLNILPADVAEELKEKGSADARLFDEVTVLFTDFVNFTKVSELLSPQELVDELNVCFREFDGITTTHNIEKIKTVGDAYLAVSGLPNADLNHAANVINAAQEIQQFMIARKLQMGDKSFGIRIGIHSGSVVAGIVGVKKFAYDIWGDTVNTAARMEQNCEAGKVNVSAKTYELVKDQFEFIYRGEIEAKK